MVNKLQKRKPATATTTTTTANTAQEPLSRQDVDRARRSAAPSPEPRLQNAAGRYQVEGVREGGDSNDWGLGPKAGADISEHGSAAAATVSTSGNKNGVVVGETEEPHSSRRRNFRKSSQNLRVFYPDCIKGTHEGCKRRTGTKHQEATATTRTTGDGGSV